MKRQSYFNNKRKNLFPFGGATNINNIALGTGGVGGSVGMQGSGGIVNTLSRLQKSQASLGLGTGGLGGLTGGLNGGLANGVVSGINTLMNPSGNNTGVGNALQTVGSIASNIPGVGGLIGAGVGLVGGLINTMFGSNINDEFVDQTKDLTNQQASWESNASDNAGLLSDWSNYRNLAHVSQDDVGSDGWFSNKARNLTRKLNRNIDNANTRAQQSFINSANNVDRMNDLLIASNYFDEGGGLNNNFYGSNTITPFVDFGAINDAVNANFKSRQRIYPLKRMERGYSKNPKDLISESPISNVLWGLGETLTPLGSIMGVLDVDRDISNIRQSPSVTKDALVDTFIDAIGILPAGRSLKRLTIGSSDKLKGLSEAFAYTSKKGQKRLRQGINDVRRSNKDLMDAATDAALARNREDAYKVAMKARNQAKGNDAKLDALEQAVNPNIYNYNMFQKVGSALDGINDILGIWDSGEELMNEYKEGGKIHIKKSKRGTFTAAAKKHGKGVQEFARQVLANKDNYSAAMVKKANFARNFGGRKRAYGGYLEGQEYDLDEATIRDLLDRGYEIEYI